MCDICQFWEKHYEIIILEIFAILYIFFGFVLICTGLNSGSQLLQLFPSNPALPQIVGVTTGIGITLMFFGINNIYTYSRDYKNKCNIENIEITLNNIQEIIQPPAQDLKISDSTSGEYDSSEKLKINESIRKQRIEKVTLELKLESMVLTAVSIASVAELGFIGILGLFDIRTIIISILFVFLILSINCQYKIKMREIKEIFNN
jgi:uncharacterized membrane protein